LQEILISSVGNNKLSWLLIGIQDIDL